MTGIEAGFRCGTACLFIGAALAICVLLLFLGGSDDSSAEGGSCGDNLTWDYDGSGKLTIDGTGAMNDWGSDGDVPWNGHANDITTIEIHEGVTRIGSYAFHVCGATSLVIPHGVVSIGEFALCSKNFTSVTLPDTLTSIEKWAMNGSGITSLVIPDSVTDIGFDPFGYCLSLTSITIGSGVKDLSAQMFDGSKAVTTVVIHGSNYVLENNLVYTADMKTAVYYPPGLTDTHITIRDGTEIIGEYAFSSTKATSIDIPDSVKRYETRCFDAATGLNGQHFIFGPNVEEIGHDIWAGCMPEQIEFHLDFQGKVDPLFTPYKFFDYETEITDIPNGLRGHQFSTLDYERGYQYNLISAAISVRYQYADGSEAAPRVYEYKKGFETYDHPSPEIDGYFPNIPEVSGTADKSIIVDQTVVYSNEMYEVLYYLDGKVVMKSLEFYGYTVDVKPYEAGGISADDWSSKDVTIENGKFVMPNKLVTLTNSPKGLIGPGGGDGDTDSGRVRLIAAGVTVLAIAAAAAALLLFTRRH